MRAMSDIHYIEEKQPHKVSEVICVKCGKRWRLTVKRRAVEGMWTKGGRMKRLSDNAIEIVNELHIEKLTYESE